MSVDELMPRARQAWAEGARSKNALRKNLRVAWDKADEVFSRLSAEDQEAGARKAQERRALATKLGSRKRSGRGLAARRGALPRVPVSPGVGPVDPWSYAVPVAAPEEPRPPVVTPLPALPEAVAVPRKGSTGALVGLAVSAAAATAGGVWLAGPGHSWLAGPASWIAAGVASLLVLSVLVWSVASVVSRLFAGRTGRDAALDLASWAVAGVAGFLAAYGQVKFAQWAGVTGSMRFLVPGILEPSVVVLLLLANRRVKRRRAGFAAKPIGKLLTLAALLGGFAVYTNVVHAGGKAGLVFGAATVVGLILWWVKLQDDAAPDDWDDEPTSKRLSRKTSRYRPLRWLILFPQTRRAWLISLDHSISDAEIGLDLARRWRREYDLSRTAKNSRRLSRRNASARIDEHLVQTGQGDNEKES